MFDLQVAQLVLENADPELGGVLPALLVFGVGWCVDGCSVGLQQFLQLLDVDFFGQTAVGEALFEALVLDVQGLEIRNFDVVEPR